DTVSSGQSFTGTRGARPSVVEDDTTPLDTVIDHIPNTLHTLEFGEFVLDAFVIYPGLLAPKATGAVKGIEDVSVKTTGPGTNPGVDAIHVAVVDIVVVILGLSQRGSLLLSSYLGG